MTSSPRKLAKTTGDEAEAEVAEFIKQNCLPSNLQLGISPQGALAFDLVVYPEATSFVVPEGFKFHSNVEVRMSDYVVVKHRTRYWEKLFITQASGLDPLNLNDVGISNVEVQTFLTKRSSGSVKDSDGNKLFRSASVALRFKSTSDTIYTELTPETCERIRDRIATSNNVATFDVKVGKGSQLTGVSVVATTGGDFTVANAKSVDSEDPFNRLMLSACNQIITYLSKVQQDTSTFKVLINYDLAKQKQLDGVEESIYNAAKLNVKLAGEPGDEQAVFQALAKSSCHPNTFFRRV